jgi:hypothetical protein
VHRGVSVGARRAFGLLKRVVAEGFLPGRLLRLPWSPASQTSHFILLFAVPFLRTQKGCRVLAVAVNVHLFDPLGESVPLQ